mgnify:FL=1
MKKVIVTTANKLSKKNLDTLKKSLTKKYGKGLEYDLRLDSSVIGGIKVVVGSRSIDMTVKGQLSQIGKQVATKI